MATKTLIGAIAMAILTVTCTDGNAESPSVYRATLAETGQKTKEVSTEEVKQILGDGSAILLDTRSPAEFEAGHIPGARHLDGPAAGHVAAVERLVNGDKSKPLVLYCNGPYCQASRRLADQLIAAEYTQVRRYQLGIPVWRALGGPVAIELGGIARVVGADQTAVLLDARPPTEFAKGTLAGARNLPADEFAAGQVTKIPLPDDDFNRRVIIFGRDAAQARQLADLMGRRPWHNVGYFPGAFEALAVKLRDR
ncbi:rhodanese-like domain-containing protein [Roseiarcaceae bacterium H3SJ34-1]|uniref:rhodanese-like domain-containing protein n=1 Tax=Terripilifer ovatus TaxID=3032367 RepID=UPI003AB951F5|nr:rhodanese-like domain-containing protein [Roseiarcaceae bacterium H3SJ34-1]